MDSEFIFVILLLDENLLFSQAFQWVGNNLQTWILFSEGYLLLKHAKTYHTIIIP